MKSQVVPLLLILSKSLCFGQQDSTLRVSNYKSQSVKDTGLACQVLLDIDYHGSICVFDSTGKIIKKIKNNFKKEDFISIRILGKNDSMYNVIASLTYEGLIAKGWIRKNNSKIGIYVRNYNSTLNLYDASETQSRIKNTIPKYVPTLFQVTDCEKNWLYVFIIIANRKYEGWLSPDMQCANPYTTCN